MAETVITDNADLLTYSYATRADLNRLAPHGDRIAWWTDQHTSGFRLVLDDIATFYKVAEADISDTTDLKRPAAAAAMRSALMQGGNAFDDESDDSKRAAGMMKEYERLMAIIGPTVSGSEAIPRFRRRQTVSG